MPWPAVSELVGKALEATVSHGRRPEREREREGKGEGEEALTTAKSGIGDSLNRQDGARQITALRRWFPVLMRESELVGEGKMRVGEGWHGLGASKRAEMQGDCGGVGVGRWLRL